MNEYQYERACELGYDHVYDNAREEYDFQLGCDMREQALRDRLSRYDSRPEDFIFCFECEYMHDLHGSGLVEKCSEQDRVACGVARKGYMLSRYRSKCHAEKYNSDDAKQKRRNLLLSLRQSRYWMSSVKKENKEHREQKKKDTAMIERYVSNFGERA